MSTSPLSILAEALTNMRAALEAASCTFSDELIGYVKEIDDDARRRFEQLEAEALEKANEEANAEAIPFDVMMEKLKDMGCEAEPEDLHDSTMFWSADAQIFSEKMASRQREAARAMENESARQAMKRRKLLHDEGSFPE